MAEPDLHDLSCVAHVHSQYSDGTAPVPELLDAAREAGAGAVLLTDHDSLGARRDGWEGDHGGVFLLVGVEVSPREGHYLAFGVEEEIRHEGRTPMEIAAAVRAAAGVGFAAHPFSRGGSMLVPPLARRIVKPHGWAPLERQGGIDGLELWSALTDAAEAWRTPVEALRWLRHPEAAIVAGPQSGHLRVWDALSAQRRVPAIGGLDGHEPGIRVRGRTLSPLSHRRTFRLLRTHLLCDRPLEGDVEADRATILRALRAGAAWLACPCVADAHGARLWAETGGGDVIPLGGEGEGEGAVLRIRLPRPARVTVIRDGEAIHESEAQSLDLDLDRTGAHRVEARIDGRLWLLSNPVHLRPPPAAGEPSSLR
jgi:hypothetical protein